MERERLIAIKRSPTKVDFSVFDWDEEDVCEIINVNELDVLRKKLKEGKKIFAEK